MGLRDLLTRKQVLFVLGANALISLVISLAVGLLLIRPARPTAEPVVTQTASTPATQPVARFSPTPAAVVHVVQSGDTISGLALQYDVPEEDIIAANQLENPNFLEIGTELIIPVGGLPEITPTWTPQPTPTDTAIPFQPPSADLTATALAVAGVTATPLPSPATSTGDIKVQITEVIAPGNADREAVVITNVGDDRVDMTGWTLNDANGNVYVFPSFRLWSKGNVTINSRIGQDNSPPANLFWGKLEPVWTSGEKVTLKDASGAQVATFTISQ